MRLYAGANLDTGEAATSPSRRAIKNWSRLQEGRLVFSPRHKIIRDVLMWDKQYFCEVGQA